MSATFLHRNGRVFLAHRLKRLSDRLVSEIGAEIEHLGLKVPPTAGSTLALLAREQRLGIVEIAQQIGVSHPFVIRLVARLEELGLIRVQPDESDLRRKWVSLTAAGASEAAALARLNVALEECYADIARETSADLLVTIDAFEVALAAAPLRRRLADHLNPGDDS
ncbi:MAG: MarR family transcriptional regulator [Porphyrobacter sp.]|nr:MarR family transcriptional regulator [Porphyrobacter sp.]